jgi:hypothetical protein
MHLPNEMHHWNSKRRPCECVGLISDSFSEALLVACHIWLDLELQDLGQGLNSLLEKKAKRRYATLRSAKVESSAHRISIPVLRGAKLRCVGFEGAQGERRE